MSPTRVLDSLGVLTGRTLVAHAVWVDRADIDILQRRGTGIAHCPSSNMKLASGVAPVMQFLLRNLPAGLGTDGPAGSNNDLDLFEEMDLAAKLQKVTLRDPLALNAEQAFEMATIRGARALGLANEIGSLETGKRADLMFVKLDAPHAVPMYNVYSQLVYALKASDVQHVMVNGKAVVRNRQLVTIQLPQVLEKAAEYGVSIQKSLK
jgi:5-methylthioadenosine/S-adenosylhomocysteine deaminase